MSEGIAKGGGSCPDSWWWTWSGAGQGKAAPIWVARDFLVALGGCCHSWALRRSPLPSLPSRMGSSALVQQEYTKCLERDFRRGHTGVCTDLALWDLLWQRLLEDPELHCTLRNDVFATLASSLQGWDDLPLALRGLARAFEVLELAAVNLHLLPWRKEFSTIKVSVGVWSWCCLAAPVCLLGMLDRDRELLKQCGGAIPSKSLKRERVTPGTSAQISWLQIPQGNRIFRPSLV